MDRGSAASAKKKRVETEENRQQEEEDDDDESIGERTRRRGSSSFGDNGTTGATPKRKYREYSGRWKLGSEARQSLGRGETALEACSRYRRVDSPDLARGSVVALDRVGSRVACNVLTAEDRCEPASWNITDTHVHTRSPTVMEIEASPNARFAVTVSAAKPSVRREGKLERNVSGACLCVCVHVGVCVCCTQNTALSPGLEIPAEG